MTAGAREGARRPSLSLGRVAQAESADNRAMDAAHESRPRAGGGMSRLLDHCETIARITGTGHGNALLRLETEIGSELARRLVGALARGRGRRLVIV